jgi:hypothetical protein
VLVVSKDFIRQRETMSSLNGALAGHRSLLLVLYNLTSEELEQARVEYREDTTNELKQQWATDLGVLQQMAAIRSDEVRNGGDHM